MDMCNKFKYTKKGPNSLGANDSRRIPIRQRALHPSMLGYIDIVDTSSSDPGQSGSLSPYNDMKSLYFDDSLYENEMHYKISQYLKDPENTLDVENPEEWVYLEIEAKCTEEYNKILDSLYHFTEGKIQMSGTPNNPMEIIVEDDPRKKYRQFDESQLMSNNQEENK